MAENYPDLPKWPALIVAGKRVTRQQATEILIRTDSSVPYGMNYISNDDVYNSQLCALFGVPDYSGDYGARYYTAMDELKRKMRKLDLKYLSNSRIASCYIDGPHGWTDWSGNVFTNSYNIGKWPTVEGVKSDWEKLAKAFPYLRLDCQLMSGEHCEDDVVPLVGFKVKDGQVDVLIDPEPLNIPVVGVDTVSAVMNIITNPSREIGVTVEGLKRLVESVYGEVPQFELESGNE